jgi:Flp pilus assembly pilin Flp
MAIRKIRSRKSGRNRKGQGITEYGAIIAFVALLVSLTFGFTSGSLSSSLSAAFCTVKTNMQNLSSAAAAAS